jgi:hypothetical protein
MCRIHNRDWLHMDVKLDNTLATVDTIGQSVVKLDIHVQPVPVMDLAHARCK